VDRRKKEYLLVYKHFHNVWLCAKLVRLWKKNAELLGRLSFIDPNLDDPAHIDI
jgi:hypothetical protein